MKDGLITRRSVLAGAASLTGAMAMPGISLAQQAVDKFTWGINNPGFTTVIARYILEKGLDKKHGFNLDVPKNYRSVPTYYNDFIAGAYELCQMDWLSAATMYSRKVPLKFIARMTTGSMIGIIVRKGTLTKPEDLKGKVFVGQQSTGAYRMTRALIKERYGLDLEKDASVQSVTTGSAGVNLVRAGQADATVTWEPHLTYALEADPNLEILVDLGSVYQELVKRQLPYFGVSIRQDLAGRDPTVVTRINKIFADAASGIMADIPGAVALMGSGESGDFSPDVVKKALESKRLAFEYGSTADAASREDVDAAVKFFHERGVAPALVDKDFYA